MVKSDSPRLTWTVFESPAAVPLTVKVKGNPAGTLVGALKVRMDEFVPPDVSLRLVGERDAAPESGGGSMERATVPEKPARLARFMVTVPEVPSCRKIVLGLAARLNGAADMFKVTECE